MFFIHIACACCSIITYIYIVTIYSAGIGRTGVFMLMETALCKMEVLEPIYPLEVVRNMRDQRGMLVQTPVSASVLLWYLLILLLTSCMLFSKCI